MEQLEDRRVLAGEFTHVSSGLPSVYHSSVAWGDYDNDGDLDILLTGSRGGSPGISRVYQNTSGTFSDISAGLTGVAGGSAAWGDYDSDGDLDILLTGSGISRVYQNTSGTFSDLSAGLGIGVGGSSVAWGDYDNDGDLDILLTGREDGGTNSISRVYNNFSGFVGNFGDIGAGLTGVYNGSVAWGDYDNDGDLDILLTGSSASSGRISRVYQNTSGTFSDISAGLPGLQSGSVAWGDYDNDGDLDILLTGYINGTGISRVYQNTSGTFSDISAGLPNVSSSSVAWGDYDNDGDLDILLTGQTTHEFPDFPRISRVYQNTSGTFSDISAGLIGVSQGSVAWGDYDNDGDLDILLTGQDSGYNRISRVYRNNAATANSVPAAPSGLTATVNSYTSVTLAWTAPSDTQTPSAGLNYNLRVGTTPGGSDVVGPMSFQNPPSSQTDGLRKIAQRGLVQDTSWTLENLTLGQTYYWSVQALDTTLAGSPFAVEDTLRTGCDFGDAPGVDFGDAPDTYKTLRTSNGPRHTFERSPLYLGAVVDRDCDGEPNATATGDDTSDTDDEDGVTFGTLRQGRQTGVTVVASTAGRLDAFVDFNADGDFADTGEKIFDNLSVAAGSNDLAFRVPSTAAASSTFARFRISTGGGLTFLGSAEDGEVEDYAVRIKQGTDLGDAPNKYHTTLISNGAQHGLGSSLFLGSVVDGDSDGQPNGTATGDDNNLAPDDEDGVTFGTLRQGRTTGVTVVASVAGKLDAFLDFNADGDFADAGEKIFDNLSVAAGPNNLAFRVPSTAAALNTYARFRISAAGGLTFVGSAVDGEVEDYAVRIKQGTDLSDAPDTYVTTLASNGAGHLLGAPLFLGVVVDGDVDGQPSATATGDDTIDAPDDEDGVTFGILIRGGVASVTVEASAAGGKLDAFLDFNANGNFADAGEKIFDNEAVLAGTNILVFAVPAGAATGPTFARFRLSTAGGLSFGGLATDGEVEDYQITIAAALQAADGEASRESRVESQELDRKQLTPIIDAAIARLAAQGLSAQQLSALSSVSFAVADLPGATLGLATPRAITLDATAAGYGWFVDPTPRDDAEFSSGSQLSTLDSQLRMDLLSAVLHELGHELGLDHDDDIEAMYETLAVGARRLV